MAKKTVADWAREFAVRLRKGPVSVILKTEHIAAFLEVLLDQGVRLSRRALAGIDDPKVRKTVETVLYSASGGAILGTFVGALAGGPQGMAVGAIVGAVGGALVGLAAIMISIVVEPGGGSVRIAGGAA